MYKSQENPILARQGSLRETAQPTALNGAGTLDPGLTHPFRPQPDPATGELIVDPEIVLKTKGFDLQIEFFYNSFSSSNGLYGQKRSVWFFWDLAPNPRDRTVYAARGNGQGVFYGETTTV